MTSNKSLLILGFPKGCTTLAVEICAKACNLEISAAQGELLNSECNTEWRHPHLSVTPPAYADAEYLLTEHSQGHVVKDVVQPWLVTSYLLKEHYRYNVLYVRRDRQAIQKCLSRAGWGSHDPATFEPVFLALAKHVLTADELLHDPEAVWRTLSHFGYNVVPWEYRDEAFQAKLQATVAFLNS